VAESLGGLGRQRGGGHRPSHGHLLGLDTCAAAARRHRRGDHGNAALGFLEPTGNGIGGDAS
jgi:hypothetical protein